MGHPNIFFGVRIVGGWKLQFVFRAATMRKARAIVAAGLSPVKLWSLAEASALLTKWASADEFVYRQV
jgi:hypothetical protein